jgi:Flp pilus assembly protein TadG
MHTPRPWRERAASEDGAILIHVAIALVVLIGFNTFVVDYGVMWVGRRMAQNSADAGALAGATALAFDDFEDRSETGAAKTAANALALMNGVWGEAPENNIATDVTFPTVPAVCADTSCIRVDVYRNQLRGNALPVLFGGSIGLTNQGVRAMAIARAAVANASDCLKPWAIPDKWLDRYDPADNDQVWDTGDAFEKYVPNGRDKGTPLETPDVYTPATKDDPGTGFTVSDNLGLQLTLKAGSPQDAIAPGNFFPIDLPRVDEGPITGGDKYRDNIASCNGTVIEVGDTLQTEPGNMVGPTKQGVEDLIALDPDAEWDPATKTVTNSCAQAATPCAARSPRIVAVPLFDPEVYEDGRQSGRVDLTIVKMLGFFIAEMQGNEVVGYLTTAPGLLVGSEPFDFDSAFLKTVLLVR